MTNKGIWIGFNKTSGIGPKRLRFLIDTFGSIEAAWHASALDLARAGVSGKLIKNLINTRNDFDIDAELEKLESNQIQLITWEDPGYPPRLKEIEYPPPVLYVRGTLLERDQIAVAVVGTRHPDAYGKAVAAEIVHGLSNAGVTIVSGLARGIDAMAHKTALEAGGRTLAVLGSGINEIYPPEHRKMAAQMAESGAVITDYPLGTRPEGKNFPPRNRIISGLSLAVIVVQAKQSSGALITANFAAEQGREVFAVPGKVFNPCSAGPHRLISDGANILLSVEDILENLNLEQIRRQEFIQEILPENEMERLILEKLNADPMHVDQLRLECKLPIQQISSSLTMLELKGRVRQVGGMNYIRIRENVSGYRVE